MKAYGDKVRLVFRDYPLPMHPNAHRAAEAANCANAQGKFWDYHAKLFANQTALGEQGERLAVGAHIAQMSRDAYLAGLITGVPALTTGASRTAEIVELIKSNAKLSSLSRNIHTLSRLLAQSNVQKTVAYRDMLDTLDGDVRVTSPRRRP
jgi:hypothetical protein